MENIERKKYPNNTPHTLVLSFKGRLGENRRLVTDAPLEFEK
jgi:hypothetical protein